MLDSAPLFFWILGQGGSPDLIDDLFLFLKWPTTHHFIFPEYRLISKKGEGTFSEVLKAQSIKTGKYVAIKCMKNHFDNIEQVNNLREI